MHYPSDVRKPPFGSYVASKSLTILTRKRGYGTYRRMILSRRAHGGAGDADAWRCLGSNDMQRLYVAETQKNPEFATEASSLIYQRIGPWKDILGTKMSPLDSPNVAGRGGYRSYITWGLILRHHGSMEGRSRNPRCRARCFEV